MSIHDTKTRGLINLHIDRHWAANNGRLKLADVRNEVRVAHPYRDWHPSDVHTACNDLLGNAIKAEIRQPMSTHFATTHDVYVPKKFRGLLSKMPRGFFNRSSGEWVDAMLATPEDWEEGEDARTDLAKSIIEASEPFKENAKLLRLYRARCVLDLIKREKKEKRDDEG